MALFAIVETSGRQFQVEAGKFIHVDHLLVEKDSTVVFDNVLMIVDGAKSVFGKPNVSGAKVTGKVLAHGKDNKIIVYKQRPKKGTRKKQGHRQQYTRVLIDSIALDDKVLASAGEPVSAPAKQKKETMANEKIAKDQKHGT